MPSKRKATFESSASSASSVASCSIGEVKKLKVTQAARRIAKRKQSDGLAKSKRVKTDEQLNKVEDKDKDKVEDKDEDEARRRSDATKNAFREKTKAQAPEVRDVFGPDVKLLCKYLSNHSDFFQACIQDQDGDQDDDQDDDQDEDQDEDQDDSDEKEEEQLVMVHTLLSSCKEEDVQVLMKMSKNEMSPDMLRVADFYGIPMKQVSTILDDFGMCDSELVDQARRAGMPRLPMSYPGLEMAMFKYKLVRHAPLDAQKAFVKELCKSFVPLQLTKKRHNRFYLCGSVFPRYTIAVLDELCSFWVFEHNQLKRGFYDDLGKARTTTSTTLDILTDFCFVHFNRISNTAVFVKQRPHKSSTLGGRTNLATTPARAPLYEARDTSVAVVNLVEPVKSVVFPNITAPLLTTTFTTATQVGALCVVSSGFQNPVNAEKACMFVVINTLDQTILTKVCTSPSLACISSQLFAYARYLDTSESEVVVLDARNPQHITTTRRVLHRKDLARYGSLFHLMFESETNSPEPTLLLNGKKLF